jgi:heavy metal response regulator
MRILLVEDDKRVASFISRGLKEEQYVVDTASDGENAFFLAQANDYDLVILDVVLPDRSGFEVLKTLRGDGLRMPVLMLTGQSKTQDKIKGLDAGADDYLTKPFDFDELLARVRALLRRKGEIVPAVLKIEDLELDTVSHRVTRAGRAIDLTNREYALLEFLMRHPGQVVTRTMLTEHVWEHDFDSLSNVINVTVARLRQKVDDNFPIKLIHTLRGKGYMLKSEAVTA